MFVSRKALRLSATVLLASPIVPLVWFAAAGKAAPGPSSACAAGATCMTCQWDGCELAQGETLEYVSSITLSRCIDFDQIPPGHCAGVVHNAYSIMQGNTAVGNCYKANCNSSLIYMSRPCDNPLQL